MDTGVADSMSIGTGMTDSQGTMSTDGVSFDDSSAAGSGITFDSGYQSADISEGTDGSTQGGSVASGGQESGHMQMADAQGVSGAGQGIPDQNTGVSVPDNRSYQQLEHDGVKYARFAADEYEKPNTSHQVVEADGKRFYEVKLEPVQSSIKATLQKDGKVHYEKTYKEVLPEVPKRKQKPAPKKENPSGKQAKGKNGSKQNKGR